jgi:Tfp pilus assembly major pilin PilA
MLFLIQVLASFGVIVAAMTPSQRSMRAKNAALIRWAKTPDRSAGTAAARAAQDVEREKAVDPDGTMPAEERSRRAEMLRLAQLADMTRRSAAARRRNGTGGGTAA